MNSNLANPTELVDKIVREVMLRLQGLEKTSATTNSPAATTTPENAGALVVNEKVVTTILLRDRLKKQSEVQVQQKAIVTPAVLDELKDRNIRLTRMNETHTATTQTGNRNSAPFICVARLSQPFVPTDWLREHWGPFDQCCESDFETLGKSLAERLDETGRAICFASQPHRAVALLNRQPELRAAFARSNREVAEVITSLAANVLVVDSLMKRNQQQVLIERFLTTPLKGNL